jgi:hypothetical protein
VRAAHWQDATAAGNLNKLPVAPSQWSVFDTGGAWLYRVTMSTPIEIAHTHSPVQSHFSTDNTLYNSRVAPGYRIRSMRARHRNPTVPPSLPVT